jgi:carbon monoxide dehydrogenase subunit G
MKLTGKQTIAASRQRVWECLNDPEVLKQCIPGCQTLEKTSGERFDATVAIKLGPIGARFVGAVTLSDFDPPNAYVITGEGQAGPAGFAKVSAHVKLTDDAAGTLLAYEADADVGGRMGQVGGAIIEATAKQWVNTFFKRFRDVVALPPAAAATAATATTATTDSAASAAPTPNLATAQAAPLTARQGMLPWWLVSVFVAALAGFMLGGTFGFGSSVVAGFFAGLIVAIVPGAGFELGRRSATPIIKLDGAAILNLLREVQEKQVQEKQVQEKKT